MKLTSGVGLVKRAIGVYFEKENLIFLLKVYFFALLVGLLFYFPQRYLQNTDLAEFIKKPLVGPGIGVAVLVYAFLDFLTKAAGYEAIRRVVAGERYSLKETFSAAISLVPKFFLTSLLVGIVVTLGFVLLIIPGIVFAVWYSLSLFVLVNEKAGIVESMKKSKGLIKGRFWGMLGRFLIFMFFAMIGNIVFSFLPFGLGSVVITIFGALFLLPAYFLYQELVSAGSM